MNNLYLNKYFLFLSVGIPSYIIALLLNLILVEHLNISIVISYIPVLFLQVIINFVLNLKFVFKENRSKNFYIKMKNFMLLILLVRLLDWVFFVILTQYFIVWYIFAQLINVAIFSFIKFLVSIRIFE
mgnify:FL=1|jgi:putative flippase GtrA